MNVLLNLRISQKIMALVAGLAVGFIAIGVAYFVQINAQTQQAKLRNALDRAQMGLLELSTLATNVADSEQAMAKANELLVALRQETVLTNRPQLKVVSDSLAQYASVGAEVSQSAMALAAQSEALQNSANALSRVSNIPPALYASLREREFNYRSAPTVANFDAAIEALNNVTLESAALTSYQTSFESYAYALQNHELLSERKGQAEASLTAAFSQLASSINAQALNAQAQANQQTQMIVAVFIVMEIGRAHV